jgi:hypothetical protein
MRKRRGAASSRRPAWTGAALLAVFALNAVAATPGACTARSGPQQVALVELYTSQGCSSCPPADQWLSTIATRTGTDRVIAIALHVDYWDYIGWKDPYALGASSVRQRQLAAASGSRTVYTPGVFLQAREFSDWASVARLDAAVGAVTATPASVRIALAASLEDGHIAVNASATELTASRTPLHMVLALVENGLATRVRGGENRGATLRNDRVVRAWHGPGPLAADRVLWPLPATASSDRLSVVAFVEEVGAGRVLQAVDLPLGRC